MAAQNNLSLRNLKIAHWNADGIKNQITEVKQFLVHYKIDILLISETNLSTGNTIQIPGYNLFTKKRGPNAKGGGVLIAAKNNINCSQVNLDTKSIEAIGIKLNQDLTIIAGYLRPQNKLDTKELDSIFNCSSSVILMGDLNCKHRTWNCYRANQNGTTLYKYLQNTPYTLLAPDGFTHYP